MAPETRSWIARNVHFLVAMVLVVAMGATTVALGWVEKLPVPWPQAIEVDRNLHLIAGLPDQMGPYALVTPELYEKIFRRPGDGDRVYEDKLLAALDMTPTGYRKKFDQRQSSWYVSRMYLDTDDGDTAVSSRLWLLNVYYYTGLRDKVPHVPEACLAAGGAEITSDPGSQFVFDARGLKVEPDWQMDLGFNKVVYLVGPPDEERRPGVEYYIFSYNGQPMNDRLLVRGRLGIPWESHNYFAKIQFSPMGRTEDNESTARAARKFFTHALPAVLKTLPTAQDVQRIEQGTVADTPHATPASSD